MAVERPAVLTAAGSRPADQRNQKAETALRVRLADIDGRIGRIDSALAKEFPEYAALANPEPLAFGGVQAQLRANEALVLFFDTPALYGTPDETFAWAVTRAKAQLVRLEPGTQGLAREVQALRCGLRRSGWMQQRLLALRCSRRRAKPRPPQAVRWFSILLARTSCTGPCSARSKT